MGNVTELAPAAGGAGEDRAVGGDDGALDVEVAAVDTRQAGSGDDLVGDEDGTAVGELHLGGDAGGIGLGVLEAELRGDTHHLVEQRRLDAAVDDGVDAAMVGFGLVAGLDGPVGVLDELHPQTLFVRLSAAEAAAHRRAVDLDGLRSSFGLHGHPSIRRVVAASNPTRSATGASSVTHAPSRRMSS